MRNWLKKLGSFNADGRPLGIGLAAAMNKQRELAAREVEDYLRTAPAPTRDRSSV
ncbi:hypothetical protein [Actinophytocola xinjiangensis]|uniref:hypothetical protein n=1 Tax=Actinophytocola xinjiangensis TaxID=485602 RepID=UPI000AD150DD|nr:hypothetical protein [Actinophytocola xinjiangensis]